LHHYRSREPEYLGNVFNPLNAELIPICHLLALLAHLIFHISRIRVKDGFNTSDHITMNEHIITDKLCRKDAEWHKLKNYLGICME
jgi:hypothetical protein